MRINDLSDVQKKDGFVVKKEEWKFYLDGFKDLLKRVETIGVKQERLKQYLNQSATIVEQAKNNGTISFQDGLIITETLCASIHFLDAGVQRWVKGEGDDIDVRLCLHHRKYLVYLLFQISTYQAKPIYEQLLQ
ncbi:hypothetical protein [Flavilitoribacter nigricans]|uniref:Uncharacterized protein n=1 Tax=Flavilitoribacter nigricans (strain ATCC 23147 / DSM 23189 / NBRC 102662 / NCIMB 1420 / SS-2) TaxID=1122177 RepID=A0A2D0NE90_FLAN2|nr:hypothetical protein [Flavilitoribacter nigricans]PHN06834.1 hypothetical protein CRP01_11155 [Flavilitoribacter nigricans DSM 23189 = NBRC 102662]